MQVFLDIILVILAVDFGSGLLHWLEDSYGHPHWPITGEWITEDFASLEAAAWVGLFDGC